MKCFVQNHVLHPYLFGSMYCIFSLADFLTFVHALCTEPVFTSVLFHMKHISYLWRFVLISFFSWTALKRFQLLFSLLPHKSFGSEYMDISPTTHT